VTPANGQTVFAFPDGDVESLCGLPPVSGWDHKVALKGVPAAGSDYDTVVHRIDKAVFDAAGNASTRIILKHLAFASINPQATPCGNLSWQVGNFGPQAVTNMRLRRLTPKGGLFSADIAVNVEFKAIDSNNNYIGSLFYNFVLPDPQNGTPWSFGPNDQFRAGMTETDNCIDVLREKLALPEYQNPRHQYFISNMIAQGKCERTN
ncbi:MAG TPA: hypothetical protein VFR31_20080, partial [Thermoanaerobaculia bacterium]|nr:hypothetical protein [Thermoanaerobaculia bacterium]